jgi:hypothetical protein
MDCDRPRHANLLWLRLVLACFALFAGPCASAQNWKRVHKADEAKWAKTTGLDPYVIHKIWRSASDATDEQDDDSRIATIDLEGLADRHDVLFATYAGEKNCLTITVFRQLTQTQFKKERHRFRQCGSRSHEWRGCGECPALQEGGRSDLHRLRLRVERHHVPLSRAKGSSGQTLGSFSGVNYFSAFDRKPDTSRLRLSSESLLKYIMCPAS